MAEWLSGSFVRSTMRVRILLPATFFTKGVIMCECVDPTAPVVKCINCGKDVHTCEREEAVNNSYLCPVHSDGAELSDGTWVCSPECWSTINEDDLRLYDDDQKTILEYLLNILKD